MLSIWVFKFCSNNLFLTCQLAIHSKYIFLLPCFFLCFCFSPPPPPTPHSVLCFCILFIDTFFIVFLGPWFQNFLLTVFVSWYAVLIYLSRIILWQGQHQSIYFKVTQKVCTLWLPERHFNKRMQNNKNYDVKMFCCACSSCTHAFTKIGGEN